ncbi:MAG: hypothetical protein J6Y62_01490 [Clostridia bacterium]|nr:hypothetical protein [Clostridia bacterium]
MEPVDVCYENNKSGTYVQFRMMVHTNDLEELKAYSDFVMSNIQKDFKTLFDVYGMAFTTSTCYVLPVGDVAESLYLIVCLQGKTSPELEDTLQKMGVKRGKFNGQDK